jgi:hypothetical protein
VRIRDDKPPEEINTLDDVRALFARLSRRDTDAPGPDAAAGEEASFDP